MIFKANSNQPAGGLDPTE